MLLKETTGMMESPDCKERFRAEYYQTKIRYERLKEFNTRIKASERYGAGEAPKHDCPSDLLCEQQRAMGIYLHILELRAEIEHVDISHPV